MTRRRLDLRDHPRVVNSIEPQDVDLDARHASIAGDDVNAPPCEFPGREILATSSDAVGGGMWSAGPGGSGGRCSSEPANAACDVA
jgi:hypothetical protein